MKTICLFILLIPIVSFSKVYNTIKSGNFDNPGIWQQNAVPLFESDTIYISHNVYFDRNVDTIKYDKVPIYSNYLIINEKGKLCFTKEYTIYNLKILLNGIMSGNGFHFRNIKLDNNGFLYSTNPISLALGGYMNNLKGYTKVNKDINVCNPQDTTVIPCPIVEYSIKDSVVNDTVVMFKCVSNLFLNIKYNIKNQEIFSINDEWITINKKETDTILIYFNAYDLCDRTYKNTFTFEYKKKANEIISNEDFDKINIYQKNNAMHIDALDSKYYNVNIYNILGQSIYSNSFTQKIEIKNEIFKDKLIFIQISDNFSNILYNKKYYVK